ncbi:hypothetical protein IQ07DRAFT_639714 [Pyrenochaeta sp. DS3sAY3a]|nr:hypothetical protein IQ07DRAFT_639714 [Pyrenochaeta sp. DS3sAY3a]
MSSKFLLLATKLERLNEMEKPQPVFKQHRREHVTQDQLESAFKMDKAATADLRIRLKSVGEVLHPFLKLGLDQLEAIDVYQGAGSFRGLQPPEPFEDLVKVISTEHSLWRTARAFQFEVLYPIFEPIEQVRMLLARARFDLMHDERTRMPPLGSDQSAIYTLRHQQFEQWISILESWIVPSIEITAELVEMAHAERAALNAKILSQFEESSQNEKSELIEKLLLEATDPIKCRSCEES